MQKTKIEWCDSTWNPVTGCLHGCDYCYARRIADRFSSHGERRDEREIHVLDERVYGEESEKPEPFPYGFVPTFHRYRLNEYEKKKGRTIFVCSMADRVRFEIFKKLGIARRCKAVFELLGRFGTNLENAMDNWI